MTKIQLRRWPALIVFAAIAGFATLSLAQNTSDQGSSGQNGGAAGTAIKPEDTGVGPRGTKAGPSTNPQQPAPLNPNETGTLPRGNKAAESTPPTANTSGSTNQ